MDGMSTQTVYVLLLLHRCTPLSLAPGRVDLSDRRPLARRTMARTEAGVRTRGPGSHSPLRHSAGFAPAFPASPSRYLVVDWRHHTSALSVAHEHSSAAKPRCHATRRRDALNTPSDRYKGSQ